VPVFVLACLAYLTIALPSSALGLVWPSMKTSFHQPVGALGILLACGVVASVVSSASVGRLLSRRGGGLLAGIGIALSALALAVEALAPSLWVVAFGFVLFGLGSGATDSALNVYAADHFGAREINWMHASYGLGASIGPLLATVMLGDGLSWRWIYGSMAVVLVALAVVLTLARRRWQTPARGSARARPRGSESPAKPPVSVPKRKLVTAAVVGGPAFTAVETGIESGAGIWGYVFLASGRGLSPDIAGVAVSAYWATMFAGRAVLGPVAERVGPARVLGSAVGGVAVGATLMTVPGPGFLAVIGMTALGLAAAPIFPLFTLTTSSRLGTGDAVGTTHAVSLQVAASAAGSAALPAGIGLIIEGTGNASALAPALLVLSLMMSVLYWLLSHPPIRTASQRNPDRRRADG
jgi:fucose permease